MNASKHCFDQWLKNQNILNSLAAIKPPSFDENNKLNVMQMNQHKMKQFVSSSFMHSVSSQLQPIALQQIGNELTANQIEENCDSVNNNLKQKQNVSLFDMFWGSEE